MDHSDTLVEMLAEVAETLSSAITVPHSPYQQAMRAAMDAPRPGDLVLITQTRRGQPAQDRVGRFLGTEEIVIEEADGDEPAVTDEAYVIVVADGRVMNWTNCGIVRLSGLDGATRAALDASRAG